MKVIIVESRARRSRAYDSSAFNIYGHATVDGYEIGSVWVDASGKNYHLEQSSRSVRLHGKLPRLTAKSVKGLARAIRTEL